MKNSSFKLGLLAGIFCCLMLGAARTARAQDEAQPKGDARIDRLEKRVNELADHQARVMRRLENGQRMSPENGEHPELAGTPATYHPLEHMVELGEHSVHRAHDLLCLALLVALVFNILIAVWITTDIRRRGEGSGIFIALAILAGIPAAIIYCLVRIGDNITAARGAK